MVVRREDHEHEQQRVALDRPTIHTGGSGSMVAQAAVVAAVTGATEESCEAVVRLADGDINYAAELNLNGVVVPPTEMQQWQQQLTPSYEEGVPPATSITTHTAQAMKDRLECKRRLDAAAHRDLNLVKCDPLSLFSLARPRCVFVRVCTCVYVRA